MKLVVVTNVPSSYRLHEFEKLGQVFQTNGITLDVIFLAKTEPGRKWKLEKKQSSFSYEFSKGIHPSIGIQAFHFNPGVITALIKKEPDWVIVGGGWNIPTMLYLMICSKFLFPKTKFFFWVEATVSYSTFSRNGVLAFIRKWFFEQFSGFIVPGESSNEYIRNIHKKDFVSLKLANFVDEDEFFLKVNKLREKVSSIYKKYNLGCDEKIFLMPARLIQEKGIIEYLSAISELKEREFKLLIAGDGPLKSQIEKKIYETGLANKVFLLGHQNKDSLLELYAIADSMILASPREPYGFVAVEAIWASLPLLISNKIGAFSDVLIENYNGFSFDPENPSDMMEKTAILLSLSKEQMKTMGNRSYEVANQNFDSDECAKRFVSLFWEKQNDK